MSQVCWRVFRTWPIKNPQWPPQVTDPHFIPPPQRFIQGTLCSQDRGASGPGQVQLTKSVHHFTLKYTFNIFQVIILIYLFFNYFTYYYYYDLISLFVYLILIGMFYFIYHISYCQKRFLSQISIILLNFSPQRIHYETVSWFHKNTFSKQKKKQFSRLLIVKKSLLSSKSAY